VSLRTSETSNGLKLALRLAGATGVDVMVLGPFLTGP
jgi:hypothetical protein